MRLAFVFLVATACTNDAFSGGDAAGDAATDTTDDQTTTSDGGEPPDATKNDAPTDAPLSSDAGDFCSSPTINVFFCSDFDRGETNVWDKWTSYNTPASLAFGAGHDSARALSATNGLSGRPYLTETQNQTIGTLAFDMQATLASGVVFVRVTTAGNATLTFGVKTLNTALFDLSGSSGADATFSSDTAWHRFTLQFGSTTVTMLEDGTSVGSVTYTKPTSSFTADFGCVTTTGGAVLIDNVVMSL